VARHLLDSDVLIWILRGKTSAVQFVSELQKDEVPAISTISIYEIWTGSKAHEEALISEFLSSLTVLPVSIDIAKAAAGYYKEFRSKGITLTNADTMIAATAHVHGLILVTQNQRDFPMNDIQKRSL
jgi:predicted nucleic acid-binding protein